MKKFLIFLLVTVFASCDKDLLDLYNPNLTSFENLMTSESGVTSLVLGSYDALRAPYNTGSQTGDWRFMRSDEFISSNKKDEPYMINYFVLTSSGVSCENSWNVPFNEIADINSILSLLDKAPIEQSKMVRFKSELLFLRALYYFDLVRFFGDVPLFTSPLTSEEARSTKRTSATEVYKQIEIDLIDAAKNLPEVVVNSEYGRATKYAALGILGRVYLTEKKWDLAESTLNEIIISGKYEFYTGYYNDIFAAENLQPKFYLFPVKFNGDDQGNGSSWTREYMPNDINPDEYGTVGQLSCPIITNDFINSFEPGDLRKETIVRSSYVNGDGILITNLPWLKKFHQRKVTSFGLSDVDFPYLRYTDVVLMYAEACNELNINYEDAKMWLNKVRVRAGLNTIDPTQGDEFRIALEKERRFEFAGEGLRWFDLVRTDRAITVMTAHFALEGKTGASINENQLLFPIPYKEITRYDPGIMIQNLGY